MYRHEYTQRISQPLSADEQIELLLSHTRHHDWPDIPAASLNPEVRPIVPQVIKTGAQVVEFSRRRPLEQAPSQAGDMAAKRVA